MCLLDEPRLWTDVGFAGTSSSSGYRRKNCYNKEIRCSTERARYVGSLWPLGANAMEFNALALRSHHRPSACAVGQLSIYMLMRQRYSPR